MELKRDMAPMATTASGIDGFPGHTRLSVRVPAAGDEAFLAQLYASTRADLLHLPVPADVAGAIIRHQQQLQAVGYARDFPDALYLVLEHAGERIGRVVVDVGPDETRVVDLAIAPQARRRGHARAVLLALQGQARRDGRALALRVLRDNAGARALYESLGFAEVLADELALQMRWC